MKIKTNNVPRDLICFYDMPEGIERDYLDYIEEEDRHSLRIVKYKGSYYDVNEFERTERIENLSKWDGYQSDSFFSGTVLRWAPGDDYEQVVMGWYCS